MIYFIPDPFAQYNTSREESCCDIFSTESANVYDSLGEALEGLGKLKEALGNYTRAVENAAKAGDKRLPIYTRNRDRAVAAAKKP
jgi:hypothetical protein